MTVATTIAQVSDKPQVSGVAADRIIGIATNYSLSRKCETALPLLFLIVVKCGDGDSCHLPSKEIVGHFAVHTNSCSNWLKTLSETGVITVVGREGNQGVAIKLNTEMVTGSALFAETRKGLQQLTEMTSSMQQVNQQIVSVFFTRLERMKNIIQSPA
jgi:hypothetical protein